MTEHATHTPKTLRRSRTDRMIAGVCGGLGRYFDLNPAFFRVGFVVLTLLGGSGLLVYGAALLVIPGEDEEDSIAARVLKDYRNKPWAAIGLGLVVVAGVLLLQNARFHPAGNGILIVLLAVGALVLWAQHRDARAGGGRALRIVGAALVLLFVAALAFIGIALATLDVHLSKGIGNRTYHVTSASELDRKYELGVGELDLDLRNVELPRGETPVDVRVGVGQIRITVPPDLKVRYDADAKWGQVNVFDQDVGGHHARTTGTSPTGTESRVLVVHARVGAGQVDLERAVR
jgi:phage shock protein PspC (stress-responsive transcriptional regulator)